LRHSAQQLCHCVSNGTVFRPLDLTGFTGFSFVFKVIQIFSTAAPKLRKKPRAVLSKTILRKIFYGKSIRH
jgi:hypothetical protein